MGTARGIIRYGIYLFIAGWMFALGVMVGRGTSPVTFDTESFQARLENIAREFGRQAPPDAPVDLEFYDALNNPVRHEISGRQPKERETPLETVPVKTGMKKATFKPGVTAGPSPKKTVAGPAQKTADVKAPAPLKSKAVPGKTVPPATGKKQNPARYTIQVAAYKDMKDAIAQMAMIEKKGVSAYRVTAEKDGIVWYRVRTGGFSDYSSAAAGLKKLKQAKIDGMIIKKDE